MHASSLTLTAIYDSDTFALPAEIYVAEMYFRIDKSALADYIHAVFFEFNEYLKYLAEYSSH